MLIKDKVFGEKEEEEDGEKDEEVDLKDPLPGKMKTCVVSLRNLSVIRT